MYKVYFLDERTKELDKVGTYRTDDFKAVLDDTIEEMSRTRRPTKVTIAFNGKKICHCLVDKIGDAIQIDTYMRFKFMGRKVIA